MIQNRNIALCIILSIVTCGIYGIYWMIKLNDEINSLTDPQGTNGGMVVLLTLVTCGIYGFFWAYKMGEKIDIIKTNNGGVAGNSSLMFLLLQIFGLGIINYCIMQTELNNVANV